MCKCKTVRNLNNNIYAQKMYQANNTHFTIIIITFAPKALQKPSTNVCYKLLHTGFPVYNWSVELWSFLQWNHYIYNFKTLELPIYTPYTALYEIEVSRCTWRGLKRSRGSRGWWSLVQTAAPASWQTACSWTCPCGPWSHLPHSGWTGPLSCQQTNTRGLQSECNKLDVIPSKCELLGKESTCYDAFLHSVSGLIIVSVINLCIVGIFFKFVLWRIKQSLQW